MSNNTKLYFLYIYELLFGLVKRNEANVQVNVKIEGMGKGEKVLWPKNNLKRNIHSCYERGRQAAMSHHYFPFRTTTFDSSGQNYFFKWYI